MAAFKGVVIDSGHPAALARFWAAALDGFEVRAYDRAEIDRLAGLGFTPETDPSVMVDGPGGLELCFQFVPPVKAEKNRLHFDVLALDVGAEVQRLCDLGARVAEVFDTHTVMLDPEGNEFCVWRS